jgi:hypothetical protein
MASKASKRERRARILGVVTLGAVIALSVSYLIAPRFSEPSRIMQSAVDELDRKVLINEDIALLQGQEESVDKVIEDIKETSAALPDPSSGSATSDRELKIAIEDMLSQIGLSTNTLKFFSTPVEPQQWTAISNPTGAYDPSQATGAAAESGDGSGTTTQMFQKPLFVTVQGPQDRLLQVLRRITGLERAIVIDEFEIVKDDEFSDPSLVIQARIFLMPSVESPLLEEEDETIDEVDTPFGGDGSAPANGDEIVDEGQEPGNATSE